MTDDKRRNKRQHSYITSLYRVTNLYTMLTCCRNDAYFETTSLCQSMAKRNVIPISQSMQYRNCIPTVKDLFSKGYSLAGRFN